ncbi:S-protein homolog 1 [Linum grandiflorum]
MNSKTAILFTLATIAIVTLQSAKLTTPADEDGLLSYHHVYIANGLPDGKDLLVHCQSKDDDLGLQNLLPGTSFKWQFRLEFQAGETLFHCYLAPGNDDRHASFEAFNGGHYKQYEFGSNTVWIAKDDGVYVNLADKKTDSLVYKWEDGRADMMNVLS